MVCKDHKKYLSFGWAAITAALAVLVVSCASAPKPADYFAGRRDDFSLLAPGAALYISADVPAARPILEGLSFGTMSGKQFSGFLDMTGSMTAAVYGEGGPRRFIAAARGKYPSGRGGIFFSTSKDWVKAKSASGIAYWRSERQKLSVFLDSGQAYVSDGDPFVPAPGAQSPAELGALRNNSVLSGWMENPAEALASITGALGIPVGIPAEKLLFGVYPAEGENPGDTYEAALRLELPSANLAGGLVRIFSMARMAMALTGPPQDPGLASLARAFFANNPVQDGSALVLKTGIMGGDDIALLFNTLSVYSK